MRFLRNTETNPYYNMAFDEFCLESLKIDEPVFYLWQNQPAVIVGLNQEVNTEVNLEYLKQNDIALARRVSGGGAVYHDWGNLNYTIVGRSEDLERDYPEYAGLMMQALRKLGVSAELSGRNDILVEGKKVSGFAKRVSKNRLMVHGTLMYDVNLDVLTQSLNPPATKLQTKGIASVRSRVTNLCEHLPEIKDIQDFKNRLEKALSNDYADEEYKLSSSEIADVRSLAHNKFARWDWIYGEIHLILNENRIVSCRFGGDFIGNLPSSDVEGRLIGVSYDVLSIEKCLSEIDLCNYFDGVKKEEIINLIIGL